LSSCLPFWVRRRRMLVPSAAGRLDFQRLFEYGPRLYVVLSPEQNYAIVAVTDSYLRATMTNREEILGRSLFEVFPDNPADPGAMEVSKNLRASFEAVVRTGQPVVMPVQKYDIHGPRAAGPGFEERYWSSTNSPVFLPNGSVGYVIQCVEDVTEIVHLKVHDDDEQRVSTILRSRAEHSEAQNCFFVGGKSRT
jgi:PAS fold